jgi:hypothetical protein
MQNKMVDYDMMLDKIKRYFVLHINEYFEIRDKNSIVKIYNLINNDVLPPPINENNDSVVLLYYGLYFYCMYVCDGNTDDEEDDILYNMGKYYLMAIDKGNKHAMIKLAHHYKISEFKFGDNYSGVRKYYKMAIEKGDCRAMRGLADYYVRGGHKYHNKVVKYYSMAVEKGDTDAMIELESYYKNRKEIENMKK